jgi:hypothetical protein
MITTILIDVTLAFVATLTVATLTIERFGQNARERGLAHTSSAGEQVSMSYSA